MEKQVQGVLRATFKPEFLNRVDDIIIFDALRRDDMDRILEIQLRRVRKLLADRQLSLELTDAAKLFLADAGFDPMFGARPLKRSIQEHLLNPMAKVMVGGGFTAGDVVQVDADGERLKFVRVPAPAAGAVAPV